MNEVESTIEVLSEVIVKLRREKLQLQDIIEKLRAEIAKSAAANQ